MSATDDWHVLSGLSIALVFSAVKAVSVELAKSKSTSRWMTIHS
jgi:hypothetical protein